MADGVPSRPSVPPDLVHLLELMHMRSEVVQMRLAQGPDAPPVIEEIAPSAPTVLDHLVEARARVAERTLAPAPQEAGTEHGTEQAAAGVPAADTASPTRSSGEDEEPEVAALEDSELPLLELNAFEAGQPAADVQPYEPPVAPDIGAQHEAEQSVEIDELLEPAQLEHAETEGHAVHFEPDLATAQEQSDGPTADPHADLAAIQDDLSRMEADLAQYERITSQAPAAEPDTAIPEGPGEDFQALLAGARGLDPQGQTDAAREREDFPFLPADGDVRLRADNGPRPGAEFLGKSTLAGATGMFCLIQGFNLPIGTRMNVSLVAPNAAAQFQIEDAVVSRLRKAPDNATEVQLTFEAQHTDVPDFVAQHYAKPSFSLFGRRRPKR